MRQPIDHERCSELLAPFVRGELDAESSSQVGGHLRDCADCTEELAGLGSLLEGDVPKLSELERSRLRRVVLAESVPLPDGDRSVPAPRTGDARGARLYRILGAAAVMAMIGGFAYLSLGGGMGGDDGAEPQTATEEVMGGADDDAAGSVEDLAGSSPKRKAASGPPLGAGQSSRSDSLKENKAALAPTFHPDLGPVDEKRLNKLGNLALVVFSHSFTVADVAEHQSRFIEDVAARAPNARGDDIRECSAALSEQFPNSLLAYGALAEFKDRGDILVLAFAWTDESSGPLEQSMVWAWSIGDCDGIPVHYSTSVIRPRR